MKKIKLTESDLMKIVKKVIREVEGDGQASQSSASNAQASKTSMEYGMLVGDDSVNKVKDSMTGAKTTDTTNLSTSQSNIKLWKDQNESDDSNLSKSGYPLKGVKKLSDGKIEIDFGSFKVKTDCTKVSKNDSSFDYSGGVYYSKGLLGQVKSQCQ